MAFQCRKCKYKFSNRNNEKKDPPKRCPWCDSEDTVAVVKSADEIVRNVDDMLDS